MNLHQKVINRQDFIISKNPWSPKVYLWIWSLKNSGIPRDMIREILLYLNREYIDISCFLQAVRMVNLETELLESTFYLGHALKGSFVFSETLVFPTQFPCNDNPFPDFGNISRPELGYWFIRKKKPEVNIISNPIRNTNGQIVDWDVFIDKNEEKKIEWKLRFHYFNYCQSLY